MQHRRSSRQSPCCRASRTASDIEIADGGELAVACAVEALVEVTQLVQRDRTARRRRSRRRYAHSARRRADTGCHGGRARWTAPHAGSLRCSSTAASVWRLISSSASAGNAGLPQQFGHQSDRRRQVFAARLQPHRDAAVAAADRQLGLQLAQPILDLLAVQRAAVPLSISAASVSGISPLPNSALLVAEAQRQHRLHRVAARTLGQHRGIDAADLEALRAPVDIGRRRVEDLDPRRRRLRLEVAHGLRDVDPRRRTRRAAAARSAHSGASVRFDGSRVCSATRCRSASCSACTRSRVRKNSRQSPCATVSLSEMPITCGSVKALLPAVQPVGARAIELGLGDRLLRAPTRASRAAPPAPPSGSWPGRELRTVDRETGVGQPGGEREGRCGKLACSTSALCSRPDGVSPITRSSTSIAAKSGCAAGGT